MATSSIGQQVVLDQQTAKRLNEIMSQPVVKATSICEPMTLCRDMEKFAFLKVER